MGTFDDIRDKAEGAISDIPPEQQQKIEQIAQEKGIPIDQAREHFFNSQNNNQNQDQQQDQDVSQGRDQGQTGQENEDQERDEREDM